MENNAKKVLLKATIDLVAENGLHDFSMKRVTQRAGVSEALIYKHFKTKDNLLYTCFEEIHAQIAALFNNLSLLSMNHTKEELYGAVRLYWMIYFDFLIKHGNETIFYFIYRDSNYIKKIQEHEPEQRVGYFRDFVQFFDMVNSRIPVYDQVPPDHLWSYILDTTGVFAKRVIRGELPDTPQSIESVWKLISGGILGVLDF